MWHAHDGMGWWMVLAGVLWLAFWATIVYLLVRAADRPRHTLHPPPAATTLMEIARQRYAAGQISRPEFQQIIGDLQAHDRQ